MRDSIDMESLNSNRYNANKKKLSSKGKGTKRNQEQSSLNHSEEDSLIAQKKVAQKYNRYEDPDNLNFQSIHESFLEDEDNSRSKKGKTKKVSTKGSKAKKTKDMNTPATNVHSKQVKHII